MPNGVEVLVEDGIASIEFVDPSLRGVGLTELFKHAPADQVHRLSRPSVHYRVPVEYARAAGLLDEAAIGESDDADEGAQGYDDGFPDMDWKRDAIDKFAAELEPPAGPLDTTGEPNKPAAIAAIKKAVEEAKNAE